MGNKKQQPQKPTHRMLCKDHPFISLAQLLSLPEVPNNASKQPTATAWAGCSSAAGRDPKFWSSGSTYKQLTGVATS